MSEATPLMEMWAPDSLPIISNHDEGTHPVMVAHRAELDARRQANWDAFTKKPVDADPPASDEDELRRVLAARIEQNAAAQDALAQAAGAHTRATALHAAAAERVAELEDAERQQATEFARQFEAWAATGAAAGNPSWLIRAPSTSPPSSSVPPAPSWKRPPPPATSSASSAKRPPPMPMPHKPRCGAPRGPSWARQPVA